MSARKSTPRGQMTRGSNGPAVMEMPAHIRATFMPNPPLKHIPPASKRRKQQWSGMTPYLQHFEKTEPPARKVNSTPKAIREEKKKTRNEETKKALEPIIEEYRKEQQSCNGQFNGMNCYNTLFIGRLAYEVTDRKLLREFEAFGPVRDIKIIKDKEGKSRGYAFVEYEHEDDMKRAYRAADGMPIEGREIVVDVERTHTVQNWLPRRLGGGLGGTRLGGKDINYTRPGRFDPARPEASVPPPGPMHGMGRGDGPPPPPHFGGYGGPPQGMGRGGGFRDGPPPPRGHPYGMGRGGDGYGGPPPPRDWDRRNKRPRSRSPDRRYGDRRRRY